MFIKRCISIAIVFIATICTNAVVAQNRLFKVDSISMEIHFRHDDSRLDTMYMGNNVTLNQLREFVKKSPVEKIDSVVIVSHSSPEGVWRHNQNLSRRRALTMRTYIENEHPSLSPVLRVNSDGESWSQLRECVRTDTLLKKKSIERVLNIIDDNSVSIETKKWRIENDPVYRYLYSKYYPRIRNSMMAIFYSYGEPMSSLEEVLPKPVKFETKTPLMHIDIPRMETIESHETLQLHDTLTFALKSNVLYDLATAVNAEVEVPIGNHWSAAVEYVFPWWEKGNKYCLQTLELGAEARYWFNNNTYYAKKLQGMFVGAYCMSAKYDFQWKRNPAYQGEYWSAGVTYGYAMPISRRFNVEFSLSVGYLSSTYRHYIPADDYSELWRDKNKQGRVGYFGPTKLKVALVMPLNIKYTKGGRR